MRVHVKKNNDKTFCGLSYGVYRASPEQVLMRKKQRVTFAFYENNLKTDTFARATCVTCRRSFSLLAEIIVESNNLHCLLNEVSNYINNKVESTR